ncbi:MAG TPA: hypothetical protein VFF78_00790 [Anaerolineaceae bacterium]|nr:hypothetical protein [Anaerolineaceae bacterium]
MNKRILGLALLISFLLAACSPGVPQGMITMPLISDNSWSAFNVSVAVEADGDKHIAWSECPPAGDFSAYCRVIYQRTRSGEIGPRLIFSSPDYAYYMANIVALNDGRAVISFYQAAASSCRARYAIIPDVITSLPPILTTIPGDATESSCYTKPLLATNGTTVYSVVDKMHSAVQHSYQYRKLLPTLDPNEALVVAANLTRTTDDNSNMVADVDSSGTLHTAWTTRRRESGSPDYTYGIEYANNNGVTGNLTATGITSSSLWVGSLDMAVQSATKARVVYVEPTSPNNSLWLATINSGVVTQTQISLTPSLEWIGIYPSISNYGETTTNQVVVFSAKNNTLAYSQIFYKLTSTAGQPVQLTDTNAIYKDNFSASVVPFDTGFIAGWRTYSSCPESTFFSYLGGLPVTAFTTTGGCTSYGQTMQTGLSSSGGWVVGAWIDKQSTAADARLVPWISFNTNTINLPLISR